MDAYNFIQNWPWRKTKAGVTARDNARYATIENNFFCWKNLIRCLPTFSTEKGKNYSFQVALLCSKYCSMDKSINPEILNKYLTFITENVVCVCYIRTPRCFLALCFGEISPFEVRNVHKFLNIFYISTKQQNTNIILSVWNQNNKIWEMGYKYLKSCFYNEKNWNLSSPQVYLKLFLGTLSLLHWPVFQYTILSSSAQLRQWKCHRRAKRMNPRYLLRDLT
jgi:hypothetical protein